MRLSRRFGANAWWSASTARTVDGEYRVQQFTGDESALAMPDAQP